MQNVSLKLELDSCKSYVGTRKSCYILVKMYIKIQLKVMEYKLSKCLRIVEEQTRGQKHMNR